jgi:hypothetical protein
MVVNRPWRLSQAKDRSDHPADAGGNELSVAAARNGLDGDAECLTGLGQSFAPVAEIAERWAPKAAIGELT